MKPINLKDINPPLTQFVCKGKIPIRLINNVEIAADFIANSEEEIKVIATHMNSTTYAFVLYDGMMYKIEKYVKLSNTYTVSVLLAKGDFYEQK